MIGGVCTLVSALLLASAAPANPSRDEVGRSPATSDNREMTAIFTADQAAREQPATIDWTVLRSADKARRARTQMLLDSGKLESGGDFYHAAYVFQHGDDADDYLKAHALALAAMARGKQDAAWIAAATLDRYLQGVGQGQVYGTQFTHPPGGKWTQEPYRRDLLSDAVRRTANVPPLASQEEQRREWERKLP